MTNDTKVLSVALVAAYNVMFGAIEAEAGVREDSVIRLNEATASAWTTCRDTFLPILAKDAGEGLAVLEALTTACKEAKETREFMGKGVQYASDLKRAYKLVTGKVSKGKSVEARTLPEALKAATRPEWLEHGVWKEAGILSAAGRPAAAKPEAKPEAGEGEEAGESVSTAAKPDVALSSLMAVVGQLRGAFRAEFLKEAEMLAVSILAKQAAATGSGPAAANVTTLETSKPEAKPEARKGKGRKAA